METVVVESTLPANENGWFTVVLEDGRKTTTKDRKIVDAAFASRGTPVEADINAVQNGKFTNHYLNAIAGVGKAREAASGNGGSRPKQQRSAAPAATDEKGERIARQWAYGRATELLASSGGTEAPLLSDSEKAALKANAEWLLAQTA